MSSNATRIDRAEFAVRAHSTISGSEDEPISDNLVDLLANLMHLCRTKRLTFDDLVETARMHFEEEVS